MNLTKEDLIRLVDAGLPDLEQSQKAMDTLAMLVYVTRPSDSVAEAISYASSLFARHIIQNFPSAAMNLSLVTRQVKANGDKCPRCGTQGEVISTDPLQYACPKCRAESCDA